MRIGEALLFCQRLNEATKGGKRINIQNLINVLKGYTGPDISLDRYNQILYALNTSKERIGEILEKLADIGISPKLNPDVYLLIRNLLMYRGHEYNNFASLSTLLDNRSKKGLRIAEFPDCTPFSVLELAAKKFATDTIDRNDVLASELANITGQTKGTSRGKCEVLLGIVSRNGNIAAQSHSEEGKGDVIVDGVPIEVKCSAVQGKALRYSTVKGSAGVLGNSGKFGYRAAGDIHAGLYIIFKNYYTKLKTYANGVNPLKLLKATPLNFSLDYQSKNSLDRFLLGPLAGLSIKDPNGLRKFIIETYRSIFYNNFIDPALSTFKPMVDQVITNNTRTRNLNAMISDLAVVAPASQNKFIREVGCCYIKLYKSIEDFRGLLVMSIWGNSVEEGAVMQDKAVFISGKSLALDPIPLAKKIEGTGIQFVWPRLDKNARGPLGIVVT